MKQYLLVDAGNSRLKWCSLKGSELGPIHSKGYEAQSPAKCLNQLVGQRIESYSTLVIVSVLGETFIKEAQQMASAFGLACKFARPISRLGNLRNGYERPQQLGADRFVALYAASVLYEGCSSIVIDCGTAVTIDALKNGRQHMGGQILPGLNTCLHALVSGTRQIENEQSFVAVDPVLFAGTTQQAINSGSALGLCGAIDAICDAMERDADFNQTDTQSKIRRLICGGDAEKLLSNLHGNYTHQPDLVMLGLKYLLLHNHL